MLSGRHIRLLKKIQKNTVIRTTKPNKDLDYLYKRKYIEITECDKPGDYFAQPYLTDKGEAKLYELKKKFIEIWLPVAVSNVLALAALIISIIALTK